MASMSMVEQLEEQPPAKKPRIDHSQQTREEYSNSNEAGLPKSAELKEHKESGTSTTIVDLPGRRRRHLPLPLELNCEIFKCLKLPVQRKFIWGLGRGIYVMFGQKLLIKIRNPNANTWNASNTSAIISPNGLKAQERHWNYFNQTKVYAEQAFPISGQHCRVDNFPGTICYYYEINLLSFSPVSIGLSDGTIPARTFFGKYQNSYSIYCGQRRTCPNLAGKHHLFELPEGAIQPKLGRDRNVYGCGLLLYPNAKLTIFFTLNGKLLGKSIPIYPSVDRLFPTVCLQYERAAIEANFGDNLENPFEYDIHKCTNLYCDWHEIEEEGK